MGGARAGDRPLPNVFSVSPDEPVGKLMERRLLSAPAGCAAIHDTLLSRPRARDPEAAQVGESCHGGP